jgi:hypothetical protein
MIIKAAVDGFDYETVAQGARKWTSFAGTIVTGVFGVGKGVSGYNLLQTLPANYATGFLHFHYYTGSLANAHTLIEFSDSGSVQTDLRRDILGALLFTRAGTTLGSASTKHLSANTWYDIVIGLTVNDTTGTAEVRVDGVAYVALSAQDTKNTANAFFNQLHATASANATQIIDNFFFWDTTSGTGNDLTTWPSGTPIVDTGFVSGPGANADWTPSASTNASNVDDNPTADDDATYNSSLTVGNIDTFAVDALHAGSGTIIAIIVDTVDRIDDATPHTVSHRIKSSSATVDGTAFNSSASYNNHQTIFTLDPNTGAAPTVAARNAMNFGYKLIS